MADLSLDLSNKTSPTFKDLLLVNGDLVLTKDANPLGTDNIQQNILQRLAFIQGEWFMDNTYGVPWYQQILTKSPDLSKIDTILQNTIIKTPGVTQLLSYSQTLNRQARTLSVSFSCMTTNGKVDYSGAIGG